MATGDRMCTNCNQWLPNCKCWLGKIRRGEPWTLGYAHRDDAPPNPPSTTTTTAKPGDPTLWTYPGMMPQTWEVTTTTTTTYKRKRRHYRREVY